MANLLGGHPYLTHKALYTLVNRRLSWEQLTQEATSVHSPFGDHLRRYLWLLRDEASLRETLKSVLNHRSCPDEISFYRLAQAGLIKGNDSKACQFRCQLYERYFQDKLE
jgi:hypothetical protein